MLQGTWGVLAEHKGKKGEMGRGEDNRDYEEVKNIGTGELTAKGIKRGLLGKGGEMI